MPGPEHNHTSVLEISNLHVCYGTKNAVLTPLGSNVVRHLARDLASLQLRCLFGRI
jgi:hypothetical protein